VPKFPDTPPLTGLIKVSAGVRSHIGKSKDCGAARRWVGGGVSEGVKGQASLEQAVGVGVGEGLVRGCRAPTWSRHSRSSLAASNTMMTCAWPPAAAQSRGVLPACTSPALPCEWAANGVTASLQCTLREHATDEGELGP
jgi:hypothetical protein